MEDIVSDESIESGLESVDDAEGSGLGDAAIKKGPPGLIDPNGDH